MSNPIQVDCPDCGGFSRREFMKATAAGAGVLAGLGMGRIASAAEVAAPVKAAAAKSTSETLVASLYKSLNEEQKKLICYPFDNLLRSEVNNNWHITDARVGKNFTPEQQDLITQIFKGLHSEEYADAVVKQVDHDSGGSGGLAKSSLALFGEPGIPGDKGKFEFVLTGRHCTRRCDGDSVEGHAFGGPIFYGHAAQGFNEKADHPDNVYWYQAKRANELFQALDGKQREIALRTDPRKESGSETVKLAGKDGKLHGLPAGDMTKDQRELLKKVMADVLAPFRKQDVEESMKMIEANDGFNKLAIAYYKNMDIGNDGVWDVWQVEGPNMVWYFRGSPHVHVWVNIKAQA